MTMLVYFFLNTVIWFQISASVRPKSEFNSKCNIHRIINQYENEAG